jgi:hypothetical protein
MEEEGEGRREGGVMREKEEDKAGVVGALVRSLVSLTLFS